MKTESADSISKWLKEQQANIKDQHDQTMKDMLERMKSLQDMLKPEPPAEPEPMPVDPFVGILLRLDQLEAEIRDIRGLQPPVSPSVNNDPIFGSTP